jgi:hypothetical protein
LQVIELLKFNSKNPALARLSGYFCPERRASAGVSFDYAGKMAGSS